MGLRGCAVEDWLDSPCLFGDLNRVGGQIALKSGLIERHLPEIYACLPESTGAASELLGLVADAKGFQANQDDAEPLLSAGRSISDDLLLLAPDAKTQNWVLKAGLLAFPSHWALHEKMGRPMSDIHAPVPGYAKTLEAPVNRFLHAMKSEGISVRMNWTLQVGKALFTPSSSDVEIQNPDDIPDNLYLRAERQTFRKLPETGWIVFGIGTHIAPLGLWQDAPEMLSGLQDAVVDLSPEMRAYRGMHRYEAAFHKYVDSIANRQVGRD